MTTPTRQTKRTVAVAIGVLVLVVIIALVVALASGNEDSGEPLASLGPAHIPIRDADQTGSISIDGDRLPRYDATDGVDPAVGMVAPTVSASYFDTTRIEVDFADGTPRVVLFLAHWCPHCQAEVSSLGPWFEANGVPEDVDVVAVSTSVDPGASNFPPSSWFLRSGWPAPVIRDSGRSEFADAFGLSSFPFLVAVNGDGEIVQRVGGGLSASEWEALLASAVR